MDESNTPLFMMDPKFLTQRLLKSVEDEDTEETWRSLQKLKKAGVDLYSATGTGTGTEEKNVIARALSLLSASGDALCLLRAHKLLSRLNRDDKLGCLDGSALAALSMAYAKAAMFELSAHAFRLMLQQKHHYPPLEFWKSILELWIQNTRGAIYAVKVFFEICRHCITVSTHKHRDALVKPDMEACIIALRACAKLGDAQKAEEVITKMVRFSLSPNNACFCLLMKAYEKGGQIEHLNKVLVRMKKAQKVPDRATLNSLLKSCINLGEIDIAADVVLSWSAKSSHHSDGDSGERRSEDEIHHSGGDSVERRSENEIHNSIREWKGDLEPPCADTYTLLLKGFLQKNRFTDAAKFLSKLYRTENYEYVPCWLAIEGVLKLGLRDETNYVLEALAVESTPADSVSYAKLVEAYCKLPQPLKAEAVLHDARRVGHMLSVGLYGCVIDAYSLLGDYDSAQRIFREMKRVGVSPLEPILDKLFSFFEKHNKPYMMFKLLNTAACDPAPVKMEQHHWNRTIQTFCKGKLMFDAKAAVKMMKQLGFDANAHTYVFLLGGYILVGSKTNEILLLWAEIKENLAPKDGSTPLQLTEELLNGFLTIFVKYGYFKNALDVIAKMEERKFWADKEKYRNMYWQLHKDLYTSKHRSQRRVDMSQERRKQVDAFKSWVGLST